MGIAIFPFGAVSKLPLAAAIALGSLMSLYLFFCNALKFIINRCDDSQHYPPNLEQDWADEILYGVKFSIEALQASLPSVLYQSLHRVDEDGGSQNCAVCLSEIANVEEVRQLPHCRHLFHTPCIDTWLQCHHHTCPICRASLLPSLTSQPVRARLVYPLESAFSWLTLVVQEEESSLDIFQFNNHIYARP